MHSYGTNTCQLFFWHAELKNLPMRIYTFLYLVVVKVCTHIALSVDAKRINDSDQFGTDADSVAKFTSIASNESTIDSSLNTSVNVGNVNEERGGISGIHITTKPNRNNVPMFKSGDQVIESNIVKYLDQMDATRLIRTNVNDRFNVDEKALQTLNEQLSSTELFAIFMKWQQDNTKRGFADRMIAAMLRRPASIRQSDPSPWPRLGSTLHDRHKELGFKPANIDGDLLSAVVQFSRTEWHRRSIEHGHYLEKMEFLYSTYIPLSTLDTETLKMVFGTGGSFENAMMDIVNRENKLKDLLEEDISINFAFEDDLKATNSPDNFFQWLRYCQLYASRLRNSAASSSTSKVSNGAFYFNILDLLTNDGNSIENLHKYFSKLRKVSVLKEFSNTMLDSLKNENWLRLKAKKSLKDVYEELIDPNLDPVIQKAKYAEFFRFVFMYGKDNYATMLQEFRDFMDISTLGIDKFRFTVMLKSLSEEKELEPITSFLLNVSKFGDGKKKPPVQGIGE
ncbi:hypothetical protein Plhal304r1_c038g0114341 [Plasmopara halstedii]